MENKGFEFTLNSRNLVGEFKWDMAVNISLNRNEVLTLPDGNDIFYVSNPGHILTDDTQVLREGEPVGSLYRWIYEGVAQTEEEVLDGADDVGGEKFADLDEDGACIPIESWQIVYILTKCCLTLWIKTMKSDKYFVPF